jgi:hypothetical protein
MFEYFLFERQFAVEQEKLRAAEIAKLPRKEDELNKIVEKNGIFI